ncbi:hydrogen gas-evolving membrane-bound hydrogenase subunit E [Amycolatopsis aidingensis]|uniref:hydrogen gas-evolving membrane-bound hydrogenase subunit E n=1 Tax=Amycolatopsis aidingensis TaxID=2842453 RepID=UPI001C0DD2BD|nr:hydrogen gas-evolving membrane-bound hydrogenase subunit E [Amycolatopsis aidingensis]
MLVAIAVHFAVACVLPLVARRYGRWAFGVAALVPAGTLGYSFLRFTPGDGPVTESFSWAPRIGLDLVLRLDALAMVMIVLVAGIGALVLCYYACYAKPGGSDISRNSVLLLVFAGSMLGLVLADDVFSLYIFWELTTVCSFLLVGGDGIGKNVRRSAMQALLVTALGGLAMLLGLILLGVQAGTFRVSEIVAAPPSGTVVDIAVVLVLLGAFTKSAQVPFHPWLPAAMVAPTPVSAYLHAAAMVKAGVYLVARFAPGFADLPAWWVPVLVLGVWTMVLGGFRALREHDLKILLAFGTVSQLGFLMVLLGTGSYLAAIAGATMLLAHGFFKSTLFLTVGAIDRRTGTRDIRELSGLGARWPAVAVLAGLAAASMAGVPPLLGFVGKEAALEAYTGGGPREVAVLAGLVLGSVFTVAYSLRFLVGAFGTRRGAKPAQPQAPGAGFGVTIALPALAGLVLPLVVGQVEPLLAEYAGAYPAGAEPYHLALWHGWTLPLLLSAVILGCGYLAHRANPVVLRMSGWVPGPLHAQRGYHRAVTGLDGLAHGFTGRVQTGSLPTYIGTILLAVVLVPGTGLLTGAVDGGVPALFDTWLQLPVAIVVLVATATVLLARRRLTAVLLTGVVGYGIGALFLVHGGTDLALAQFLVESLTLVVFVFVLRRFPSSFVQPHPPIRSTRWMKATVAGVGGVFVALLAVLFSGNRPEPSAASTEYLQRALPEAGAHNVVNAILVDFRAFDTVGEIVVLAVAATGAASLALATYLPRRRTGAHPREDEPDQETEEHR